MVEKIFSDEFIIDSVKHFYNIMQHYGQIENYGN